MKAGMTSVDVAALAAELDALLVGGRFDKAYQPSKDRVLLRFRRRGGGRVDVLTELGRFCTAVARPPENPAKPSMVAQTLRRTLHNARVVKVEQLAFDRVLRFVLERGEGTYAVVVELFGEGNLLLVGPDGTILLPMRGEDYAHRRLRRGEPYMPPPAGAHPLRLGLEELRAAGGEAKRDMVRFLALDLGLGPLWAEEVCLRADVEKDVRPGDLDAAAWDALHGALGALGRDIARNDLAPGVVHRDGEPVDAVPFTMVCYGGGGHAVEEAPSFHEALDMFFRGHAEEEDADPRRARFEEERGRLLRRVEQAQDAVSRFGEEEAERHADGEALYASFQEVQQILEDLRRARGQHSWEEVAARLEEARGQGVEAALRVPELDPHRAAAVLVLRMPGGHERRVEVDVRVSVQENAERHYEAAKRARSRREGAAKALESVREKLAELEARGLDAFGAAPAGRLEAQRRHFWFENYRFTVTPSGLIAVGGRNAGQNDQVVKKYLRDGDRYVHAEMHGAPSVVVRPADGPPREVPAEDLRAACQFAACSSRAWRQFAEASAYWVTPQQVSKTPRSGEFVPRGAWIVHGRRNVEAHLPMEWAVGRVRFAPSGDPVPRGGDVERMVEKVVGGPPACLAPFAESYEVLVPGEGSLEVEAARLAEELDATVEEVQHALPPGPVRRTGVVRPAPAADGGYSGGAGGGAA